MGYEIQEDDVSTANIWREFQMQTKSFYVVLQLD